MEKEIKINIQFYPSKKRLVPNFKLCKVLPTLSEEKYARMVVEGKSRGIVEKKNYKKLGDIVTTYRISNVEGYDNTDPLNIFDYAVYSVCISNFAVGNFCITLAVIYRGLTGKVSKGGKGKIPPDMRKAIINSLKKLMGTIIEIDETQTNAAFNYSDTNNSIKCSSILPAYFDERTINGQDATVIYFDRESPLMEIARNRKQLLTYDIFLLDVPGQKNTLINIMLKNYVIIRVVEIKGHKQLRHIITFADVFGKCHLENAHAEIKRRAREVIIELFEHLKAKGFIKSFEVIKKGNAFYSINFTYR